MLRGFGGAGGVAWEGQKNGTLRDVESKGMYGWYCAG
jgi:hypothetical protein